MAEEITAKMTKSMPSGIATISATRNIANLGTIVRRCHIYTGGLRHATALPGRWEGRKMQTLAGIGLQSWMVSCLLITGLLITGRGGSVLANDSALAVRTISSNRGIATSIVGSSGEFSSPDEDARFRDREPSSMDHGHLSHSSWFDLSNTGWPGQQPVAPPIP